MPDILRTTADLEAFAPEWARLWAADPAATPFQHAAWLLPWWRQFGEGELRALRIADDTGHAVGLLPFYIYREPESGERKVMLLGVGTSDYLGGVLAPECTDGQLCGAIERLLREDGWDTLLPLQLQSGSRLLRTLQQVTGAEPFPTESCCQMPAVTMGGLPQKIRRNAMYYRNRATRVGRLEYTVADEHTCLAEFATLQQLHTARWQQHGEPGVLAEPRVLSWHQDALPRLARAGLLRMGRLRLNEEPLGALYSLADPPGRAVRRQYFYLTAYSTAHADLRPGTLLLAHAIEHAALEGVEIIDMLRGEEGYKAIWHLERRPTYGFAIQRSV